MFLVDEQKKRAKAVVDRNEDEVKRARNLSQIALLEDRVWLTQPPAIRTKP